MATLELSGIRKSFGPVEVLHSVDLSVADGEMIVIVGASGCGKSTLLRIVAGLETPTAGRVRIAGRDVTPLEPADRDIAMVFQNYALYPHMTVAQNMGYGLKIRGLPRADQWPGAPDPERTQSRGLSCKPREPARLRPRRSRRAHQHKGCCRCPCRIVRGSVRGSRGTVRHPFG